MCWVGQTVLPSPAHTSFIFYGYNDSEQGSEDDQRRGMAGVWEIINRARTPLPGRDGRGAKVYEIVSNVGKGKKE